MTEAEISEWRRAKLPMKKLERRGVGPLTWVIQGSPLDKDDNLCHPDQAVYELERRDTPAAKSALAELIAAGHISAEKRGPADLPVPLRWVSDINFVI